LDLKKTLIVGISILFISGCASVTKQKKQIKPKDIPALKPVVFSAIGGDVKSSLTLLDTVKPSELSQLETNIAKKYRTRFSTSYKSSVPSDGFVYQVIDVFRSYWHRGLLKEFSQEAGFKWVFDKLTPLAASRGYKVGKFSEKEFDRMAELLMDELKK